MPTPGLSLVGFLSDPQQALNHLKVPCVPDPTTKTDAALIADWQAARASLGKPITRAGRPRMTLIPQSDPHVQQLLSLPWAANYLNSQLAQGASFQMVEIEPLLAYQLTIDLIRSKSRAANLSTPPTRDELMSVCLPLFHPNDAVHISGQGQFGHKSIIVKSRSLNLQIMAEGALGPEAWGIQFAWALPFVHVTRFNGRCYLHNGYHRALQIRKAGAVEMPCFFRDTSAPEDAGIQPPGTFDLQVTEASNPPTIGHFVKTRALKVKLRASMRVIQIGWSQHVIFDE
jgi:hypothetical protein